VIAWDDRTLASSAGAELARPRGDADGAGAPAGERPGPLRVVIDSREARAGDLFVGLSGSRHNGGDHAPEALARGAWGVLVDPASAPAALGGPERTAAVLTSAEPLHALQRLAGAWRAELGAQLVGITGSTGKTSTKDILAALLRSPAAGAWHTVASAENFNTEIGLPLAILEAPPGTEALVLEMAMRGAGQIAELAAIARPDVGLIVNIGPVHLEQLGSLEAVAAAKAELIAALVPGATAVIPSDEPLLARHRREDVRTITFGPGGDVQLAGAGEDGTVTIRAGKRTLTLRPSFTQAYNLRNLLAAVAAAEALGAHPSGPLEVRFSSLRGDRLELPGGVLLINDCYNANPMSMRAALDDLAATARGRRVAVLGDMLELGPEEHMLHDELGAHAASSGVQLLLTVGARAKAIGEGFERARGELAESAGGSDRGLSGAEAHAVGDATEAAALLPTLLHPGDTVLVKGSRGMRLERVADVLSGAAKDARQPVGGRS
jgi:UDP-N-acetylmuramoyl-tripeptide--D-alanyl-D-alanine ligase